MVTNRSPGLGSGAGGRRSGGEGRRARGAPGPDAPLLTAPAGVGLEEPLEHAREIRLGDPRPPVDPDDVAPSVAPPPPRPRAGAEPPHHPPARPPQPRHTLDDEVHRLTPRGRELLSVVGDEP